MTFRWHLWVFSLLLLSYTAYYVTCRNYPFWLEYLVGEGGYDKSTVGSFGSMFQASSAAAKILGGVFVDTHDPKAILVGALAAASAANLLFASTNALWLWLALWGANGVVQAFGWPALCRIFAVEFADSSRRGVWYSLLSLSQNLGSSLTAVIVPVAMSAFGWTAALWMPGWIGLGAAVFLAVALPTFKPSASAHQQQVLQPGLSLQSVLRDILRSRDQWLIAIGYFCISVVRSGVADWTPVVMADMHVADSRAHAAQCVVALDFGGCLGSVFAGVVSDTVFEGRRGPVMTLTSAAIAPLILIAWSTPTAAVHLVCYVALGVASFSPHIFTGLASREYAPPTHATTAGGFVKAVGQLGGVTAGAPLAAFASKAGWGSVSVALAVAGAAGALCFAGLWTAVPYSERKRPQKSE